MGQLQLRTVPFPSPPPRPCSTICHGDRAVRFVRSSPFGGSSDTRAPRCPHSLGIQLLKGCGCSVCCGRKATSGTDHTLAGGPRAEGRGHRARVGGSEKDRDRDSAWRWKGHVCLNSEPLCASCTRHSFHNPGVHVPGRGATDSRTQRTCRERGQVRHEEQNHLPAPCK